MPIYRVVIGFSGNNQGWQETHQISMTSSNPQDALSGVLFYCQKRANLLGTPYRIVGGRISRYLENDGTRSPRGALPFSNVFVQSPGSGTGPAEPADVALLISGVSSDGTRTNTTFFGAPSDAAVTDGGAVVSANGGLQPNFDALSAVLTVPGTLTWGWGISTTKYNVKCTSIAQNADGTITFTFPGATFAAPDFGLQFPARARRFNQGKSPVNGQLNVIINSATTCTSVEVIAFAAAQNPGFLRIYLATRPFQPYNTLRLGLRVGEHKRGRPFGAPRGRAPARVRG
jgi:hypothetical protein